MTDDFDVSPEYVERDALEAAQQAFLDFVKFEKGKDLTVAIAKAIAAYETAYWKPLVNGAPPTFRDVMVKDGFWRYKPVPPDTRQAPLVAPSAKGKMPAPSS